MPEGSKNGEMLPEAQMGGALPATSRHTRRLPLLPSGPDGEQSSVAGEPTEPPL